MILRVSVGGYKGYGLGLLVEIFCGILADADYANNIRLWKETDRIANLVSINSISIQRFY
jgi:LDH2 family malate/lactate/ureidoglycolate dehydrogenase